MVIRHGLDDRGGALRGVARFEDAASDEYALGSERHHQRRVRGSRDAAGSEVDDGKAAELAQFEEPRRGDLHLLRRLEYLVVPQRQHARNLRAHGAHVAHGLHDVAGPRLALRAYHRGALLDAAQRLGQIARAADERDAELPLVDVVNVVGGRQNFALVYVVYVERFEYARLRGVADAALRHDGDAHGALDFLNHPRVAHARDAARGAYVRRHALERHDRAGSRLLGYARLLRRSHVHNHAAAQHTREIPVELHSIFLFRHRSCSFR